MTLQEVLRRLFVYQSHELNAVRRPLSDEEAAACAAWIEKQQPALGSLLQEIGFLCERLGRWPQVSLAVLGNPQNLLGLSSETLLRYSDFREWEAWADANAEELLNLLLASALCDALKPRALKAIRESFPWPEGLAVWF